MGECVCQCGEQATTLESCRHPGCKVVGCESCDEVTWCCSEYDEADGEFFCTKHSYPEPKSQTGG